MGQLALRPKSGKVEDAALALERLVPQDIVAVAPARQRYAQFTNNDGGILDDLMVANFGDHLFLVVNAACKTEDEAHLRAQLSDVCVIDSLAERALIALQGPKACAALTKFCADVASMRFMDAGRRTVAGFDCFVSRSGYTGEDGYEISAPAIVADDVWNVLLSDPRVKPIGLGARDSLRLEAGLPLYGHDLDETVSPIEGDLGFAVNKSRRDRADFPGAARIASELAGGLSRVRVALKVLEGAPAREGAEIADTAGNVIGVVTSGGFSPTLKQAIALGFVTPAHAAVGMALKVIVRGKAQAAEVVKAPFVPHRYVRKI
jgi:aminomethyltransferase